MLRPTIAAIIMMTSNLGATFMTENPSDGDVDPAVKTMVNDAITRHFPPEVRAAAKKPIS